MENETRPNRSGPSTVYLHIGTFKTGTTYLQNVLGFNDERLRQQGVLFPGGQRWREQSFAVHDLLGTGRRDSDDVRTRGAWNQLVGTVAGWDGPAALVSVEFLALARPGQVRKVVRAFAPADIHVVLTARDLVRVIPAMWQESIKVGNTWSWESYVSRVADGSAQGFWNCQDLIGILDNWESVVPRDHIHVVTVPPAGSPSTLLLERFCTAVGIPFEELDPQAPWTNESMGAAEAEALRLLNAGLGGRLTERQYRRVARRVVARTLAETTTSARVALGPPDRVWAEEHGRKMADEIGQRGYHVVGDLADLASDAPAPAPTGADDVTDREVLDAAVRALTEVTEQFAKHWWAHKRPDEAPEGSTRAGRIGSSVRGAEYRAKRAALGLAERSEAAGRAASAYRRLRGRGHRR